MKRCSNTWDQCQNQTDHPSGICDVCRAGDEHKDYAHDVREAVGKSKRLLPDIEVRHKPKGKP